jgi:hypothetical protein
MSAQLVLHHLRRPFAGANDPSLSRFHAQIIDDPLGDYAILRDEFSEIVLATAFDVAVAFLSPVLLDLARRRSAWSDGLPPSSSYSSCRWFPRQAPTRRLGRTGTQQDL